MGESILKSVCFYRKIKHKPKKKQTHVPLTITEEINQQLNKNSHTTHWFVHLQNVLNVAATNGKLHRL